MSEISPRWRQCLIMTLWIICVHFQSPVLSVLLLYGRLAPELVTGTVKKSKLLGATVLTHRADQQQTKNFVYIRCSSRPKIFICCCSALCFKTVAPSSLLFLMVPVTSMGPSPQSSTMSTNFPLLYSMIGLAGTGGQKKSFMLWMVHSVQGIDHGPKIQWVTLSLFSLFQNPAAMSLKVDKHFRSLTNM